MNAAFWSKFYRKAKVFTKHIENSASKYLNTGIKFCTLSVGFESSKPHVHIVEMQIPKIHDKIISQANNGSNFNVKQLTVYECKVWAS